MLEPGLELVQRRIVRRDDCITFLGGDVRPSLATPSMIRWMEYCCRDALVPHLPEGEDSVGTRVCVEHLAATPMGQEVAYIARLVKVDGRRVRFDVIASDGTKVLGKGTHDRFVVNVKRFAKRLRQ